MSVMDTLVSRRTYRRFAQKAVPQDVVDDIVQAVRLSSCGANRQAVRLVLVQSPEMVAKVQPLVKWAGYLPPEQGTPKADELPTFYAAVVQDTAIPGDLATDTGIALANMTLAAWDKGVGSCIMGAIDKPALTALLACGSDLGEACAEALGYLDHTLENGFRPGMGHLIPDRMFWAAPDDADEPSPEGDTTDVPSIDGFVLPPHDTQH